MLENAPVSAQPNLASQQVIDFIDRKEWESAQAALTGLKPSDDIESVHRHLLKQPHPSLWVTFLENTSIKARLNKTLLQSMYDHYHSLLVNLDYDLEWEVVHSLLFTLRAEEVSTQLLAQIAKVKYNEDFTYILNDLLSLKMTSLWFAFIRQPAIVLGLRSEHYKPLIEKASHYALTQIHDHEDWVILLTLCITKAYPASYLQMLSAWPAYFPIMLNFAVGEINQHCQGKEPESIPQTTKWLCFLLKLAEQAPFLTLWQKHPTFQNNFAATIKPLSTIYIHQLVALFPHQITTVLQDCKTKLGSDSSSKMAISLIKALHNDQRFKRFVLADPILCQALGIVYVPEVPLKPTRPAPLAPQRSASLPPIYAPGYENIISPKTQRPSSAINIVSQLEDMVLDDERKKQPPI